VDMAQGKQPVAEMFTFPPRGALRLCGVSITE